MYAEKIKLAKFYNNFIPLFLLFSKLISWQCNPIGKIGLPVYY